MKTIITSMFLVVISTVMAMPTNTDSLDKGKKSQPSSNPATQVVSVEQIQQENLRLQNQINLLENEKGTLQFKLTMQNMVSMLHEANTSSKVEDLEAKVNFSKLMGNTLLLVQSNNNLK